MRLPKNSLGLGDRRDGNDGSFKTHYTVFNRGTQADRSSRRIGIRDMEMVMNTNTGRLEVQPAYPDAVLPTSGAGRGEHEKRI